MVKRKGRVALQHRKCEGLLIMLDVMAKALENASFDYEAVLSLLGEARSVIKAYEPYVNGRCAK